MRREEQIEEFTYHEIRGWNIEKCVPNTIKKSRKTPHAAGVKISKMSPMSRSFPIFASVRSVSDWHQPKLALRRLKSPT